MVLRHHRFLCETTTAYPTLLLAEGYHSMARADTEFVTLKGQAQGKTEAALFNTREREERSRAFDRLVHAQATVTAQVRGDYAAR